MSDNHHVIISGSQMSCGVAEMSRLSSDPEKILYQLASHLYHPARGQPYAFVCWSDTKESNGEKLAEFVKTEFKYPLDYDECRCEEFIQHHLWVENPKTSNEITIWMWAVPHEQLKSWYIEQRVEKAKKL